jgi:hypothetical protein
MVVRVVLSCLPSRINVNSVNGGKLMCLKFNLEAGRQFYREIASREIYKSVYESPCDSAHDLQTKCSGF